MPVSSVRSFVSLRSFSDVRSVERVFPVCVAFSLRVSSVCVELLLYRTLLEGGHALLCQASNCGKELPGSWYPRSVDFIPTL